MCFDSCTLASKFWIIILEKLQVLQNEWINKQIILFYVQKISGPTKNIIKALTFGNIYIWTIDTISTTK